MHPVRDKVMGRGRNVQGSSSSHGAAPGGPICPLQSLRDEKGTCKAALPLEVVPEAGMSLSAFCLTVVGLSINFWK